MILNKITISDAVYFVIATDDYVAATITPHHLLINRNAMFEGGIRPHHYCLPVPKREDHRVALLSAATGNSGRFFSGTDSAPHKQTEKESACGCAGIYSAYCAIELYADCSLYTSDAADDPPCVYPCGRPTLKQHRSLSISTPSVT